MSTVDNFEGGGGTPIQFNDEIDDEDEGQQIPDNKVGIDALTAIDNFGSGPE